MTENNALERAKALLSQLENREQHLRAQVEGMRRELEEQELSLETLTTTLLLLRRIIEFGQRGGDIARLIKQFGEVSGLLEQPATQPTPSDGTPKLTELTTFDLAATFLRSVYSGGHWHKWGSLESAFANVFGANWQSIMFQEAHGEKALGEDTHDPDGEIYREVMRICDLFEDFATTGTSLTDQEAELYAATGMTGSRRKAYQLIKERLIAHNNARKQTAMSEHATRVTETQE